MPSPLATILFTWAAIYAYVGAFYCMLYGRRRTHREYLAFGLTSFALATWAAGAGVGVDARTLEHAAFALRLRYVGGFAAAGFFSEFAVHLGGPGLTRERRVVLAAYAVSGLAVLATVAGWLVDVEQPFRPTVVLYEGAGVQPSFTPLGIVVVLVPIGFSAWAVWVTVGAIRRQRELRAFAWAGAIALLAGAHDTVTRVLGVQTLELFAHAGLFPVLTISWLLSRRFVRAAAELSRRTDELHRSYTELRVTQEELVRKEQLAAVGELSAVIAHEVRNPLAIIKNAVSSLRRSTLRPADRGVLLGILDEEVDRLNRLVRDLLAYARPVEPRGRTVELGGLVEAVVETSLAGHEEPSSVRVELDVDRCATVFGDPDLLRQALANVLDNAVAAMPSGGALTIRAEPSHVGGESAVALEVADTGEGMDTLVLSKARDPFFTTRASGTGLGLAIVERVVKNHGGSLAIDSRVGQGTTVRIVVPDRRPSSVPPERSAA
jgi:signal transduction histidine kinase